MSYSTYLWCISRKNGLYTPNLMCIAKSGRPHPCIGVLVRTEGPQPQENVNTIHLEKVEAWKTQIKQCLWVWNPKTSRKWLTIDKKKMKLVPSSTQIAANSSKWWKGSHFVVWSLGWHRNRKHYIQLAPDRNLPVQCAMHRAGPYPHKFEKSVTDKMLKVKVSDSAEKNGPMINFKSNKGF